jgi:hypothetical protein
MNTMVLRPRSDQNRQDSCVIETTVAAIGRQSAGGYSTGFSVRSGPDSQDGTRPRSLSCDALTIPDKGELSEVSWASDPARAVSTPSFKLVVL